MTITGIGRRRASQHHPPPTNGRGADPPRSNDVTRSRPAALPNGDPHPDPTSERTEIAAAYEHLLASQREEIAFLRHELERRADEVRGLDALVREVLRRLPPSPPNARASFAVTQRSSSSSPGMGVTHASRGDPDAVEIGPPPWRRPPSAMQPEESWWQRWWNRLIGRE